METTKRNLGKVLGMIIIICALASAVLNLSTGKNMDSLSMPFILLMVGIVFLSRKQSEESEGIKLSPQKRKIVIATLSISLIAGIVTLIMTLL